MREPLRLLARNHSDYVADAAAELELLNAARRFDEARRAGEQHLAQARQHGAPLFRIELALARTQTRAASASSDLRRVYEPTRIGRYSGAPT